MDKITEALKKLLPAEQVAEVSKAVEAMLAEAKGELEKEYNTKLEEAYNELTNELKGAEQTAEKGYQEAYTIITDMRNRLDTLRAEFESQLEEGYEEAYQMLLAERGKNEKLEASLYEEYDKKLGEMKEYMIDKLDEFLQFKGKEIYEQARRDIVNDPALAEHKLTLDKIVETVSSYITDEDFAQATSGKIEDLMKTNEDMKGQIRILEARNIRVATENNKLNEALRSKEAVITEANKNANKAEKKERIETAKNVTGRGKTVTENVEVIGETKDQPKATKDQAVVSESVSSDQLSQWRTLAGIQPKENK
jgi:hypothetical protein